LAPSMRLSLPTAWSTDMTTHPVSYDGQVFADLGPGFDCSRCHCRSHGPDETGHAWYTYRAALLDAAGEYFPKLCGDANGAGCLSDVLAQQGDVDPARKEKLRMLLELMPEEVDDGIVTEMEDDWGEGQADWGADKDDDDGDDDGGD